MSFVVVLICCKWYEPGERVGGREKLEPEKGANIVEALEVECSITTQPLQSMAKSALDGDALAIINHLR